MYNTPPVPYYKFCGKEIMCEGGRYACQDVRGDVVGDEIIYNNNVDFLPSSPGRASLRSRFTFPETTRLLFTIGFFVSSIDEATRVSCGGDSDTASPVWDACSERSRKYPSYTMRHSRAMVLHVQWQT